MTEATVQLEEFVRKHVGQPDRAFELYITPPKSVLKPSSFLSQKLLPAAVVYFSWLGPRKDVDVYLTEEAKAEGLKHGSTAKHLTTFSSQKPVDYGLPTATQQEAGNRLGGASASDNGKGKEEASSGKGGDKKPSVPSWLKLGKK